MQENRGKLMSNTANTTNTAIYNVTEETRIMEEQIANEMAIPELTEEKARSLAINVLRKNTVIVTSQEARKYVEASSESAPKHVVLLTEEKLRGKFGPDMGYIHGALESDLKGFRATVAELVAKGELFEVNDVDSDIFMWTESTHKFHFQVFKGQRRRTSQLVVKLANNVTFRDVNTEAYARAEQHEDDFQSNKMPLRRPAYIAAQKGETGIRVEHRHSSVQLATDFAVFLIQELDSKKASLTRSMNMLNEFIKLKDRLNISDDERTRLAKEVEILLSTAKVGLDNKTEMRESFDERAQIVMGMKTVHNTAPFKSYIAMKRANKEYVDYEQAKQLFALEAGIEIWESKSTTEGMRNAARRKAMTSAEADRLAEMENTYVSQLKAEMLKSASKFTNGTLKLAVIAYIDGYNYDKEGLGGLATMWDTFEEGLLMALDAMAVQGPLMNYKPAPSEMPFFFEPSMQDITTVKKAHAELTAMKVLNKDIKIVTVDGEVGLQLEAGFFPLEKKENKVKWLPAGRDYVAKVTRYKNTIKTGISMGLSDIRAINVPEEELQEVQEAVVDQAIHGYTADADYDWAQEPAPDYIDGLFFDNYEEEAVEAPQPVVLAPTEIIVATLERNTVEAVLSQQYEMAVSPLGTQVFMLHDGQRILSFTTDVELSSLDGMRHDGTNFVI